MKKDTRWLHAAGCRLLAAGCMAAWLHGCWLHAAGCWLLAACCMLHAACCWLHGCWLHAAAGCMLQLAACLHACCWLHGCWLAGMHAAGCMPAAGCMLLAGVFQVNCRKCEKQSKFCMAWETYFIVNITVNSLRFHIHMHWPYNVVTLWILISCLSN